MFRQLKLWHLFMSFYQTPEPEFKYHFMLLKMQHKNSLVRGMYQEIILYFTQLSGWEFNELTRRGSMIQARLIKCHVFYLSGWFWGSWHCSFLWRPKTENYILWISIRRLDWQNESTRNQSATSCLLIILYFTD